jgi:catechol 2,3-dioxygenase-like lactoylglutathione lyase family enzyme
MTTLDHVTLVVSDYARSKTFYEKALAPLGIKPLMEFGQACGFGRDGAPGLRMHYHPKYYGAFVLDPDGHDIEAVCHSGG